MRRDAAIKALDAAVSDFVLALPRIESVHANGTDWGTHEVLSHLVFWHETYVRIVEGLNGGTAYAPLAGVFREFNQLAVLQFRTAVDAELARRLTAAQRRLAVELAALPPSARIRIKGGAKGRGPAEFADRVAAHIRGHLVDLSHKSRRLAAGRSLAAPAIRSTLRA